MKSSGRDTASSTLPGLDAGRDGSAGRGSAGCGAHVCPDPVRGRYDRIAVGCHPRRRSARTAGSGTHPGGTPSCASRANRRGSSLGSPARTAGSGRYRPILFLRGTRTGI
ncbi:MAG TPA: hypothetical protein VMV49_18015 [Candidatus Deferrimicrobium sp.]|nr:hypothetical protein [Candidatus Deferrimicrobium sp.]